jgi:polyhydroxyalkanoate synthesis regulator phasin
MKDFIKRMMLNRACRHDGENRIRDELIKKGEVSEKEGKERSGTRDRRKSQKDLEGKMEEVAAGTSKLHIPTRRELDELRRIEKLEKRIGKVLPSRN